MRRILHLVLLAWLLGALPITLAAQKKPKSKKGDAVVESAEKKKEPEKKDKEKKIKAFADIITEEAISDDGLFNVYKVDDKYYFEIGDSLLEKEILIVSRVSGYVKNLSFGGAGMKSRPQQVIRW
jgi:hypothetical protein